MTVQAQTRTVYLSYSRTDPALAAEVVNCLKELGLAIHDGNHLYDPSNGYEVAVKIREAIQESDILLVLATPASIHSQWLTLEIGIAIALQKPIYVALKDLSAEALPTHLRPFPLIAIKNLNKLAEKVASHDSK